MTRPEIKARLQEIAEEVITAERWLDVARGAVAEVYRARLAGLEEEQRLLEGCLTGPDQGEAIARSSGERG